MSVFDKLEGFEQRCQTVTCSGCAKQYGPGQKFCTDCGIKLVAASAQIVSPRTDQIKCGKCFHSNPSNTKFCSECGSNLVVSMTTGREATDLPRAPRAKYVPPDHTQSVPVVRESAEGCYDISGMNIRGN